MVRGREEETTTRRRRRAGARRCCRRPSHAASDHRARRVHGALAGLRTRGHDRGIVRSTPTGRRFPGRWRAQCCMTAVVPTHRCGAVPDSHRVPSCLDPPGWRGRTSCRQHHIWGRAAQVGHHMLCRRVPVPWARVAAQLVRPGRQAGCVARGNPVRIRDCPAAVSGNDRRHTHWVRHGPGKRRPVGGRRQVAVPASPKTCPLCRARPSCAVGPVTSWAGRRHGGDRLLPPACPLRRPSRLRVAGRDSRRRAP